jgi:Outer membrane protein beta-barrel domain
MKSNGKVCMFATGLLALTPAAFGQKWEVGGGGGGGFYSSQSISNSVAGNAEAKIATGPAFSAWVSSAGSKHWAGELRYDFQMGNLQLSSGASQANFGSATHTIQYHAQYHFRTQEDNIRPFVAFGGGMKLFQGTGTEVAAQPLNQIALLTRTNDVRPVISGGFGVKARLSQRWSFRAGVYDNLTPFPSKVITPNSGSKVGGWLQDIVPIVGVSYLF